MPRSPPATGALQQFIDNHFADAEGLSIVGASVANHVDDLEADEYSYIADAVTKRRHEFSTGRYLARQAMTSLGLRPCAIGRDESRRPVWPDTCLGSISHSGTLAVAAVARSRVLRGLGVDLEEPDRVAPQLHRKLFTAWERDAYAYGDPRWAGLLFSAKEAGYKAVNPLVGNFIGFQEVEIDVDWTNSRFSVRYVGEHLPNKLLDVGLGYFGFFQGYVVSLFMIPNDGAPG